MSFQWTVTPDAAWGALAEAKADAIENDILALAEQLSEEAEQWMKANHPWRNQTGAAEAALFSIVYHAAQQYVEILVSHGSLIDYALFLELGGNGVIAPTVDWLGPKLFQGVQQIVRRHSGG